MKHHGINAKIARLAAICLAVAVLTAVIFCTARLRKPEHNVQLPNPIVPAANAELLNRMLHFPLKAPTILPEGYQPSSYSAISARLAQIIYQNGTDGEINYRMALGEEDISGDYNQYDTVIDSEAGGIPIVLKGDAGSYRLAIWTDDGYSYALGLTPGLTDEEILSIVGGIR